MGALLFQRYWVGAGWRPLLPGLDAVVALDREDNNLGW